MFTFFFTFRSLKVIKNYRSPGRFFSNSRRNIIPAIKCIHPDKFSLESNEVQSINMRCLQTLNEIWDMIDELENSIHDKDNGPKEIKVLSSWKSSYVLNCFYRPCSNKNKNMEEIYFKLRVPNSLLDRKVISIADASNSLNNLFVQFGIYLTILELDNPWGKTSSINDQAKMPISDNYHESISHLRQRILEASLKFNMKSLNVGIFSNESDRQKNRPDKKLQHFKNKIRIDVVTYLRMGNVKLKNIDLHEELDLLLKFQEFLIEFGPYLSFDLKNWRFVFFIIYDENIDVEMKKKYQVTIIEKNKYIIEVPKSFKTKILLKLLHDQIPYCKLYYKK